jgi:hypothetical protein
MNLGGSIADRFTGDYAPLPQRYQAAFRYGVRFFEVRFPRTDIQSPQPVFGPFDIAVEEDFDSVSMQVHYNARIITSNQSQMRFEPVNKHGLAVAWMFDDEYWHNRVIAVDTAWIGRSIAAAHDRDGVQPGGSVRIELEALREVLTEEVPIWKLLDENGSEKTFFLHKKQADDRLTDELRMRGYSIKESVKREKKKFVTELIKKYTRQPYGWTNCEEFRQEIVPQVQSLVRERKQESLIGTGGSQKDSADLLREAISKLDPGVIAAILQQAQGTLAVQAPAALPKIESEALSEGAQFSRSALDRKKVEELRVIAISMKIPRADRLKKDDLIDAILGTQAEGVPPSEEPVTAMEMEEEEEIIT